MLATNVINSPEKILVIATDVGIAERSRNPKASSSSIPEVKLLYRTGKKLCLEKVSNHMKMSIQLRITIYSELNKNLLVFNP